MDASNAAYVLFYCTRWEIVKLLCKEELGGNGICRRLNLSKSGISQHMKQLVEAGVVEVAKRGYWEYYRLNREGLLEIRNTLNDLVESTEDTPILCFPAKNPTESRKVKKRFCKECGGKFGRPKGKVGRPRRHPLNRSFTSASPHSRF